LIVATLLNVDDHILVLVVPRSFNSGNYGFACI